MTPPLTPGSPLPPPEIPSPRRGRRATALGVTAGLIGGGAIGLLVAMPSFGSAASSATTPPTTEVVVSDDSSTDDTTADVPETPAAPDAPPTDDERQANAEERIRTELQNLVDDGTITAAQADAVAADLATEIPIHGPGGRGGPGGGHRGGPGFDGEVVAGLLGIDVDALRSGLRDGKTIAEIAGEQGVDPQTVIDSLVAEARSHLDLSVENGRLTQEEADAKLADATERITDFVNNGFPQRDADQPTG